MRPIFSCLLILSVLVLLVSPSHAGRKKHSLSSDALSKIKAARATGHLSDLTVRPADCDAPDRTGSDITQIVIHSTHVMPSISFTEVIAHSLRTCAFAHYYIDRDGTVIQRFSDLGAARHTRSNDNIVNLTSIGIELYATTVQERSERPFTKRQLDALVTLTSRLMKTYQIGVDHLFRHADYSPLVDCSIIPESYKGDCGAYVNDHMDPYGWTDADWNNFLKRFHPAKVARSVADTGNMYHTGDNIER